MKLLKKLWILLLKIFKVEKKYPEYFCRGIQSKNDLDDNNYLKSSAFLFSSQVRLSDSMRELSIVWNDCDEALNILLNQKDKNGTGFQFAQGYAQIKLSSFSNTVMNYIAGGWVSYERKEIYEDIEKGIEANPYHGNILLHKDASDQMKKNIQHSLAALATFTKR